VNINIPEVLEDKEALVISRWNDNNCVHVSWMLQNLTVISFEYLPLGYPSVSLSVWNSASEYMDTIKDIEWIPEENKHSLYYEIAKWGYTQDNILVELESIGEGISGMYDPDNLADVELLRFYISRKVNEQWCEIDDASYCTRLPASLSAQKKVKAMQIIMNKVAPRINEGLSVKKACEELSWINLDNL